MDSMLSDLGKHIELADHPGKELGFKLMMSGHLDSFREVERFIEGFN